MTAFRVLATSLLLLTTAACAPQTKYDFMHECSALSARKSKRSFRKLAGMLDTENPQWAAYAVSELAQHPRIGEPWTRYVVPRLITFYNSQNQAAVGHESLLRALGKLRGAEAVEWLASDLAGPQGRMRVALLADAAVAEAVSGDESYAIAKVLGILQDGEKMYRSDILHRFTNAIHTERCEWRFPFQLGGRKQYRRHTTEKRVPLLRDNESILQAIAARLDDEETEVREAAVRAVAVQHPEARALELLGDYLGRREVQADTSLAQTVRIALLGLGDEKQGAPLMPLLLGQTDPDSGMRRWALRQLARGCPQDAMAILEGIAQNYDDPGRHLAKKLLAEAQIANQLEEKRQEGVLEGPFPSKSAGAGGVAQ